MSLDYIRQAYSVPAKRGAGPLRRRHQSPQGDA